MDVMLCILHIEKNIRNKISEQNEWCLNPHLGQIDNGLSHCYMSKYVKCNCTCLSMLIVYLRRYLRKTTSDGSIDKSN